MKKFIFLVLFFFFSIPTYGVENIITTFVPDNADESDIEVVTDKNTMYLPCKYILNYFKIPYKENHAEKSLIFNKTIIKQNSFTFENKKENYKVFFLKKGISGIQNEFFIPAEAIAKITGKNISTNPKQLLVYLKTLDEKEKNENTFSENTFLIKKKDTKPKAYEEITLPTQKGIITLDKIGLRENMYSDSYSQIYKESTSKNACFNNNLLLTLGGKLKNGEYTVDFGSNSYSQNMFAFSGISPKYKTQHKKYDYILGKTEAWDFGGLDLSSDIMGFQIKNHINIKNNNFRNIEGKVSNTSTVLVTINDTFQKEINTYGGFFNLKDISFNDDVKKIKLEEVFADKSKKIILEKKYLTQDNKTPIPNKDIIVGINGLQNRLWANNGYIYQTNTQKALIGYKNHKELSEKVSIDNLLIGDSIYQKSSDNWCKSILGNRKYLNYTTMQNQNALSGATYMGSVSYNPNEKMNSKLTYGTSYSTSTDGITKDGIGYIVKYDQNYLFNEKDLLQASAFAISPNFYLAGFSGSGFASDKVGVSLSGVKNLKKISINGTFSKYKSNFADYYEGGLLDFNDWSCGIRGNFTKFPTVSLRINNKQGGNGIGTIKSNSIDLTLSKHIKSLDISGGIRKNNYSNEYNFADFSSYKSNYSDIFTEFRFPLGKRFGYLTIGHNIVDIGSDTTKNNYRSINLQYITPSIKSFVFNFSTGLHYTGTNKGNDYGFGVTKRLKSGSTISLNYRYSQIPFYMIDNMYIPGSMRHSITLDFAELYGIGSHGLQSVGVGNENKGFIQMIAFLDVNKNGKRDKGEPLIEEVPFKLENFSKPVLTDKSGKTILVAEDEGIYNVKVFEDELPTLISCCNTTKPSRFIKVENGKKNKIEFGFISTVGNISGSVSIKDEFNNPLKVDDLIVSILDTTGKEVNYTNLNEDGTFTFSGLAPGNYVVGIDKELPDTYKLTPNAKSSNYSVSIPAQYKDYVNIDNVNLNYTYKI